MKKLGMFGLILGSMWLGACSDDDKDFVLDVSRMTNVDWYYNRATKTNLLSFSDENVLEINRFDTNGEIKGIDLRGAVDSVAGTWHDEGMNLLTIDWKNGGSDSWNVLDCTSKKFIVDNGWGKREYVTKPSYLEGLTGDAFWVNEFEEGANTSTLRLGFRISSNEALRAGYVYALISDDEAGKIELKNYNNVWKEKTEIGKVEDRKVRFSCRSGGNYVKFDEFITADNFAPIRKDEINFTTSTTAGTETLKITWNEFEGENVYYKIEVYSINKNGQATDVYFESDLLAYNNGGFLLDSSTKGLVNKLDEIDSNKENILRLTAVMLEKGVAYTNMNAENRVQAVVYITKPW